MPIIEEASKFVKEHTQSLQEDYPGVKFKYYTSGHSLGALSATAIAIQYEDQITKCVDAHL